MAHMEGAGDGEGEQPRELRRPAAAEQRREDGAAEEAVDQQVPPARPEVGDADRFGQRRAEHRARGEADAGEGEGEGGGEEEEEEVDRPDLGVQRRPRQRPRGRARAQRRRSGGGGSGGGGERTADAGSESESRVRLCGLGELGAPLRGRGGRDGELVAAELDGARKVRQKGPEAAAASAEYVPAAHSVQAELLRCFGACGSRRAGSCAGKGAEDSCAASSKADGLADIYEYLRYDFP